MTSTRKPRRTETKGEVPLMVIHFDGSEIGTPSIWQCMKGHTRTKETITHGVWRKGPNHRDYPECPDCRAELARSRR